MPLTKIRFSKQSFSSLHKGTQEFVRQIKREKNNLHTCQYHTRHYPSHSNIKCVFLFWNSRKEPLHPQRGMQTLFLLKPKSRDEGMILWGTVGGKETYGEGWTLLHKHFKRKELQEVPRGQSHSFPILAPFRTAHCSPASHCKQHRRGLWGPNRQMHVGPNQQVSQPTQFLPLERTN